MIQGFLSFRNEAIRKLFGATLIANINARLENQWYCRDNYHVNYITYSLEVVTIDYYSNNMTTSQ